jgi:hypothetical protein
MYKKILILLCSVGILTLLSYKGGFLINESQFRFYSSEISFNVLFDDSYDPRDTLNQKIANSKSLEELKGLFVSGLYNLMLKSEIHSISRAIEFLYQRFDFSVKYFTRYFVIFVQQFFVWFVQVFRKFFSLKLFSFLISALILLSTLHFISYLFFTPKAKVAPLVLRC